MANGGREHQSAPQTDTARTLSLVEQNVRAFDLDLAGLRVVVPADADHLSAAATIALMANAASVTAITPPGNRFRSAEEAAEATLSLALLAGVGRRLSISDRIDHETCRTTNIMVSGDSVRPITRSIIERLPARAVIALMHEAWMSLKGEIDLAACSEHGVLVSAVNEFHPLVGAASYQPALARALFAAAGVAVERSTVALVCNNRLAAPLEKGLREAGAQVAVFPRADLIIEHEWTAVLLALKPAEQPRLNIRDLGHIAKVAPSAIILQHWGDVDRKAARYFELSVFPPRTPGKGQWGLPLSTLGSEPVLRRITGALKAAQILHSGEQPEVDGLAQILTTPDLSDDS